MESLQVNDQVLDNHPGNQQNASKSALIFIFITILIDVIGIGIIIPVLPALIENLIGGNNLAEAAWYGGWLMIAFSVMQFLFAPVVGELSDRFGRRPVLLISLFVLGIDYFIHAFAPTIGFLFIGRILAGITGASFSVATSYIADVSTPENKAKNFGLIGAAFGLGFILGPVIGGAFSKFGPQAPFIVAGIFTLLNFLFGYFFVPESLPSEKRRPVNVGNMIPGVSLVQLGKYKPLLGLVVAFVLVNLAGQVMPTTWSFFTMELFKWDGLDVAISLAVVGALVVIVQVFLIGFLVKRLGNKRVIMLGFLLWTLGMILFCFALTPLILYVAIVPYCLGGIAGPSIQGLLSNSVSPKEQGNLQGALTQAISVTAILGPFLYMSLFNKFAQSNTAIYFPGAPYLAAALIVIASSVIVYFSLRKFKETVHEPVSITEQNTLENVI